MADLQIKITTPADTSGVDKTVRALGSVKSASQSAGKAATDAGGAIEQFGRRGSEAKDAFEGLSNVARGGEGAIFGMAKAWRALTVAFAANPITATLAVLLGILPLVKKGLDLVADSIEASNQKLYGTGERTRAAAEGMKALKEASERNIKKATEDAEALAKAYNTVTNSIDAALRRFKEVESARVQAETSNLEAQKAVALTAAKTPEQQAQITASYDAKISEVRRRSEQSIADQEFAAVTKRDIEAKTTRDAAAKALADAEARVGAARASVRAAQKSGSADAVGAAAKARDAADLELKNAREKNLPILNQANNDIADIDARRTALGYGVTTTANTRIIERVQRGTKDNSAINAAKERLGGARQNEAAEQANFNALLKSGATPQQIADASNNLTAASVQVSQLANSIGKFTTVVTPAVTKANAELEKQRRKLQRTQQGGPGGG